MFLFHVTYRMTYLAAKLYHPVQAHKSVFIVSVVSRNSPHDLVNLISEEVVLLLRVEELETAEEHLDVIHLQARGVL